MMLLRGGGGLVLVALAACHTPPPPAPPQRSETAVAAARAQPETLPASQAATEPTSAPAVKRPFCDRSFDEKKAKKVAWPPPGVTLSPALTRKGPIWINFWAAWCKPCREEMPQVQAWAKANDVQLAFVSLDDDEREWHEGVSKLGLDKIAAPMTQGFGGNARKWAQTAGLGETLPAHAILDGAGRLRCVRTGSIEDADNTTFRAYLSGLR